MTKLKSMLATLGMLLCSFSASAHDFEVGGIYYNITDSEKLTVEVTYLGSYSYSYSNEYTGSEVIPETVTYDSNTYSVTSIGDYAFDGCSSLTSITIPDGVTSIGSSAFYECSSLTSVTIGNCVTSIGDDAFRGCSSLTSITIPNSVTSIGRTAFYNCSSLTSITIPNSVTSIGSWAFYGTAWYNNQPDGVIYAGKVAYQYKGTMTSNTSIKLAEGTLGIAGSAFQGCSGLTSVTIPDGVTSIGDDAFRGCSSLTSITIPNSVTSIGNNAFYKCSSLTSVTIPDGVTSIGYRTFYGCSSLTSVNIGNSVTSIGDLAFYGCSSLTSVHISDIAAWCNIKFDDYDLNPLFYAKHLYMNGKEITELVIPDGVTNIANYVFYNCSSLTSVTISNSVKSIGSSAFSGCRSLTSITIPEGITQIEESTFYGCSKLKSVTLPKKLYMIKKQAFQGCSNLKSITIPDCVGYIYQEAFANCKGLESVKVLAETPPFAYDNTFSNYDAELNVLLSAIEAYKTTSPWSKFGTITPTDENVVLLSVAVGRGGSLIYGESIINGANNEVYLKKNEATEVTLTPDTDYAIEKVTLDGEDITSQVSAEGKLSLTLTADAELVVTFKFVRTSCEINITNNMTTFCSAYNLDFSNVEGLKAYTATGYNSDNGELTLVRIKEAKAGTGLYVSGNPGTYTIPTISSTAYNSLNMFVGVNEETTISTTDGSYTNYIYTKPTGKEAGFYKVTSDRAIPAGKAYLQIPTAWLNEETTSEAKAVKLMFDDGESTGIDEVNRVESKEDVIYDLQGRRVKNLSKGIYIINGKKVVR